MVMDIKYKIQRKEQTYSVWCQVGERQKHIALRVWHTLWKHYLPSYLSRSCGIDHKENELVVEDVRCSVGIEEAILSWKEQ